jgi:hypothetical protein
MSDADDRRLLGLLDSLSPEHVDRLKALAYGRGTQRQVPPPTDGPETYMGVQVPEALHHNWDQPEAHWWRQGVKSSRQTVEPLLEELANDEPCTLDHHGYCQMHGLPQPGPCPDGAARQFIAAGRGDR